VVGCSVHRGAPRGQPPRGQVALLAGDVTKTWRRDRSLCDRSLRPPRRPAQAAPAPPSGHFAGGDRGVASLLSAVSTEAPRASSFRTGICCRRTESFRRSNWLCPPWRLASAAPPRALRDQPMQPCHTARLRRVHDARAPRPLGVRRLFALSILAEHKGAARVALLQRAAVRLLSLKCAVSFTASHSYSSPHASRNNAGKGSTSNPKSFCAVRKKCAN
jgi:hypothetical protein